MISLIYVERDILDHRRSRAILEKYPQADVVTIDRYSEVFNRAAQNFRLQKQNPALILARKHDNFVLAAPEEYRIDDGENFYFSHMLNCIYDCRYCFLQGMYRSAHYVMFVNFEDFWVEIENKVENSSAKQINFYSGYDCDSLALNEVTHFVEDFVPKFDGEGRGWLELRTKSVNVKPLLAMSPKKRVVVAFSFTPEVINQQLEAKTPPNKLRLEAAKKLQDAGWSVGLRFDPLIYDVNYRALYEELFGQVFAVLDGRKIHSINVGPFRLPQDYFQRMVKLFPEEALFAGPLKESAFGEGRKMISYGSDLEREMVDFCTVTLKRFVDEAVLFPIAGMAA